MRYSRFKNSMLGLEPQRRNRTAAASGPNTTKSRVAKKSSAKDAKAKKAEVGGGGVKTDGKTCPDQQKSLVSSAESASPFAANHPASSLLSPTLKDDLAYIAPEAHITTPIDPSMQPHRLQMRLLTPCSDSDMLSPRLPLSPASEILHSAHDATNSTFDFAASASASSSSSCSSVHFPQHINSAVAGVPSFLCTAITTTLPLPLARTTTDMVSTWTPAFPACLAMIRGRLLTRLPRSWGSVPP